MTQTLDPGRSGTPASPDAARLQVSVTPGTQGSAHVVVCGEIDFHNASSLRGALLVALTTYRGTITVDLQSVTFCDCAGLNALLHAHDDARHARRHLRITGASRQVRRLLRLTGTDTLLSGDAVPDDPGDTA